MRTTNALALVSLLLLAACKKEGDGGNPPPPVAPPPPPAVNRAPVANAGADAAGMTGETINLNAGTSSDPDADALTYSWVIASGPAGGTLTNATQATASFKATAAGTYVLEVTVRDPGNLSSVDSLSLTISSPPAPPVFGISGLPPHVVQGEVTTIAVQLPAPAGAGGVRVTLLSSNPAAIEVPASIDVMEGDTLASFNVQATATGTASITATAPGESPVTVEASIEPDLFDVVVSSGEAGVMVGGTPVVGVTLREPAPAGGARVSLTLSNAARASLAATHLDFAGGTTTSNTTLTALSPGAVEVSATLDGTHSSESVRLGVIPVAASGIRTSESLIGEKRDAGQITAEQALVYRVLASFGAAELPAEFRGNDYGKLDGGAVREATLQLESLSPTAQTAIGKYLFPPIYSGSWGQAQKAAARRVNAAAADSCFDRLAGMPTTETLPGWKVIRTASFKIWYPTVIDSRNA
ncbi:MAG TPA: PKD domain-containing protein, partial [Steroidobacteraceae bacterium]|nr:PKD domain-containing protein [Steroidobacteraceae bacterium]